MNEYEGVKRKFYKAGAFSCEGTMSFVPVCPKCHRFVKADRTVMTKEGQPHGPNATCGRCGRVQMPFEGYL